MVKTTTTKQDSTKSNWGGVRPNSGRKALSPGDVRVQVQISISPIALVAITEAAEQEGMSRSGFLIAAEMDRIASKRNGNQRKKVKKLGNI